MRLDIGCGTTKKKGWVGMDLRDLPGVDIVMNWDDMPWPIEDNVCDKINAHHVVEHVNPANGNFINWMNECWRISKIGGTLRLAYPEGGTTLYWADPTHCNGCNKFTWAYFDPDHFVNRHIVNADFYNVYQPKPWKVIKRCGLKDTMEYVILRKRGLIG